MNAILRKREYAKSYMREKRKDPVFAEKERIENNIRFANRNKEEYNQKKQDYRKKNLEKFKKYEKEYSRAARLAGKKATRYRKRLSSIKKERFVSVIINSTKMFWKPKNRQLHYRRNDLSDFIPFRNLSKSERQQLQAQISKTY